MGYYKNLTNRLIAPVLFGVGEIHIPADAKCVEIADSTATAINEMAYPNVILEKVTPKITAENSPLAIAQVAKRTSGIVTKGE